MDLKERIIDIAPHYAVMLVLMFGTLALIWEFFGDQPFWRELLVLLAITIAYPSVVRRIGYAPRSWQRDTDTE